MADLYPFGSIWACRWKLKSKWSILALPPSPPSPMLVNGPCGSRNGREQNLATMTRQHWRGGVKGEAPTPTPKGSKHSKSKTQEQKRRATQTFEIEERRNSKALIFSKITKAYYLKLQQKIGTCRSKGRSRGPRRS